MGYIRLRGDGKIRINSTSGPTTSNKSALATPLSGDAVNRLLKRGNDPSDNQRIPVIFPYRAIRVFVRQLESIPKFLKSVKRRP